jgi:hypothetical protein
MSSANLEMAVHVYLNQPVGLESSRTAETFTPGLNMSRTLTMTTLY